MNGENSALNKEEAVRRAEDTRTAPYYRPSADIIESADGLKVLLDIPGAKKDSINIAFEDNELTVDADIDVRQGDKVIYLLKEYGVGNYRRSFRVGELVDPAKISAEYKDGVLTISLPKAESARPRKIEISADN